MLVRTLIVILLLSASARVGAGQRVEIRDHPDPSTEVLWSDSQEGIYRSDEGFLFVTREGMRNVRLDGTVMTEEVSVSGSRIGVLLKMSAAEPLQLRVFARDGTLETMHELPHHSDDSLPQLALSDAGSGEVVYARPATAEVCFVRGGGSVSGEEDACVRLFKDAAYTHERNVFVEASPDGRTVAVAAQREAAHPELSMPNTYLFLFDRSGTLMWRRPLSQPAVRSLGFSPASLIAVSTYDAYSGPDILQRTTLVTADGEKADEAPYGADAFAFGDEEILAITTRQVAALNVTEGTSRLVHSVLSGRQVLSAASGDVNIILLTGRRMFADGGFVYDDLQLLRLDNGGSLVSYDDIYISPQRAPRVEVGADPGETVLILDRETHFYSWPR